MNRTWLAIGYLGFAMNLANAIFDLADGKPGQALTHIALAGFVGLACMPTIGKGVRA
jgi:hypothetical protein